MSAAGGPQRPPKFIGKDIRFHDATIENQYGPAAALVFAQITWFIHTSGEWIEGRWWVRLPIGKLMKSLKYQGMSKRGKVERALDKLEDIAFIEAQKLRAHLGDGARWYTINEATVYETCWPESDEQAPPSPARRDQPISAPTAEMGAMRHSCKK